MAEENKNENKQQIKSNNEQQDKKQDKQQENPKTDAAPKDQNIDVTIEPDEPTLFNKGLREIIDAATNLSRMSEQGIINERTGAAVVVRTDGQINLTPSKYSSVHLNPNGKITEQSLESETISNRKKFTVDDFVVNEHKLNPQLWELADMRAQKLLINQNVTIGNLTIDGHVLVKAWEPNLKRYMLIRRPWRGPMFGPTLNVPEINTALKIDDPLKLNEDILALSEKGYQVNGVIRDAKSLIGKNGVDRAGSVNRSEDAMSGTGGTGGFNGKVVAASAEAESIFKALRSFGYNDITACGILGNLQQESGLRPDAKNEFGYTGIAQWDPAGRWPECVSFCQSHGKDPYDAGAQISFMVYEATTTRYPDECSPDAMNKKCPDVATAVHEWVKWFEGAVNADGTFQEEGNRQSYGAQFYERFKGK